jgi:hypothetical protein
MRDVNRTKALCAALVIVAIAALGLAGSAAAKLTGLYTRFEQCPYTNTEVKRCIYSVTESGEVVLGSSKVPITKPVVLQGGLGKFNEETGFTPFFAATNGITLEKVAQPVPGGLAGILNCKEISEVILRAACELTFENGATGLNSTLELAKPATEIKVSQLHLSEEAGTALEMPVKLHLENPFLGSNCYVGSSSSPVIWQLTTGTTSPPSPNTPIKGYAGFAELFEEGRFVLNKETKLVDNAWSAPGATGCGGFLVELLLDPVINAKIGTTTAGHNTAVLVNTISLSSAAAVKKNNEENP